MYNLIANNEKNTVFAIVVLIAVLLFLLVLNTTTFFEDGSFITIFGLSGCVPGQLCALGG